MVDAASDEKPSREALQVQLVQLNERARHYGSRVWQLPFAYIGVVLLVAAQKGLPASLWALLAGIGVLIAIQVAQMNAGIRRAVRGINHCERELGLAQRDCDGGSARHRPWLDAMTAFMVLLSALWCLAQVGSLAGLDLGQFATGAVAGAAIAMALAWWAL